MPRRMKRPGDPVWNHELFEKDLQRWLKEHEGSQLSTFAAACGISVTTLHRLRTGGQDPAWSNVLKVCKETGRKPEEYAAK